MFRVGSTFTGVGGADLGLERAGMQIVWQCELDAWKRSVLAAHWPNIPIHKDVVELADHVANSGNRLPSEILHKGQQDRRGSDNTPDTDSAITQRGFGDVDPVDVLIGGFPCQDLSVAGKRKGFTGERSVLAFEFLRIAESLRPRWLLMENVPGLFSSNGGKDFARLIDEVVGIGYGVSWRILDARYFGVPQRRRRAFIVARRTDAQLDSGAAAELALRALWEGSGGDSTPGWPPRQDSSPPVGESPADGGGIAGSLTKRYGKGVNTTCDDGAMVIAPTVTRKWAKGTGGPAGDECQNLVTQPVAYRKAKRAATDQDDETWVADGGANTLNAFDVGDTRTTHAVVNALDCQRGGPDDNSAQAGHLVPQVASTLQGSSKGSRGWRNDAEGMAGGHILPEQMSVRRLTPIECERLMGWPETPCDDRCGCGEPHGWTAPPGVKAPDSKRYAACGDGIVSWCAYWIGQRMRMIDEEMHGTA